MQSWELVAIVKINIQELFQWKKRNLSREVGPNTNKNWKVNIYSKEIYFGQGYIST